MRLAILYQVCKLELSVPCSHMIYPGCYQTHWLQVPNMSCKFEWQLNTLIQPGICANIEQIWDVTIFILDNVLNSACLDQMHLSIILIHLAPKYPGNKYDAVIKENYWVRITVGTRGISYCAFADRYNRPRICNYTHYTQEYVIIHIIHTRSKLHKNINYQLGTIEHAPSYNQAL